MGAIRVHNGFRRGRCPLCGSLKISLRGELNYTAPTLFSSREIELDKKPELWKCLDCKSSFAENILPEDTARRFYTEGASGERWSREPFEKAKTMETVQELKLLFKAGSKVLDVGCNTGELLDFAKAMGCATTGVEPSEKSRVELCRNGHEAFASMGDVKGDYDVVTAFDLVEHLYDPSLFFNLCRKRLKDGGRLVVLTGDAGSLSARRAGCGWWYMMYPEHIVFPSRRFFKRHSGFRVEKWVRTYASVDYAKRLTLYEKINWYRNPDYRGLPALGPDHLLAILRK